jgi:hypothetical protein
VFGNEETLLDPRAAPIGGMAFAASDVGSFLPDREPHVQISVRLMGKQRAALKHFAKRKGASVREFNRATLEQSTEQPAQRPVQGIPALLHRATASAPNATATPAITSTA